MVISAEGYKDLTVNVNIEEPEEPDTPDTQPAPTAPTATVDDNGNVTLAFNNLDNTWQGKITSIKVNEQVYTEFTGSYPSKPGNNEYDWQYGSQGQELYLDKTSFNPGANTVVISAEGYEDLTVTVKITKPEEPPAPAEQEPPAVTGSGYDGMGALELKFGSSEAARSYLSKGKGSFIVVVNRTTYKESESEYLSDDEFYVSEKYNSISLSDNAFTEDGNTTIIIKADGYKDLTITINKYGNLV